MKKAGVEKKATKKAVEEVLSGETSKSQKMKALFDLGFEVKEIADMLNVRYNFVYNVVSNYVGMNGIETTVEKKESKKDVIVELFKQGKSMKEIAIELKTNYNYVFNVVKEFKKEQVNG